MKRKRSYGSKQPSRAYQRTALQMVLVHRENLDGVNVESLARSHGIAVAEVERALSEERQRRAQAA